jgi:soluble lytic murein transglycosylase
VKRTIFGWLGAIALLAAWAPAALAAEGLDSVRAAVTAGRTADAIAALAGMESADPAVFRANNYDYLLGRLLERNGDLAAATARYTDVIDRGSNLSEYALWRLAGIARLEGDFARERRHLDRLVARYGSSLLVPKAVTRIGVSAYESGDWRTVMTRLGPLAGTRGDTARDALARVATARMRTGDRTGAKRDFARLVDGSQDDYALAAARGLDELDRAEGAEPNEFDRIRRARIYLNNRDWAGARPHFRAVADLAGSPNRAEALYGLGLTHYRVEEHDAAIDWWTKVSREFPTTETGTKAFLWIGHAYQRAGKYDRAVSQYEAFIEKYPSDEQLESAYRNAIDSLRSAGDAEGALRWCDRAEAAKPRSALATFAAFNRAKTRLSSGNAAAALADFTRLKSSYNLRFAGPGMPVSGEVDLLRGVCLERLGRTSEAISLYMGMTPGIDDYFGNRASLRLRALGERPEGRAAIERLLTSAVSTARSAGSAVAAKEAAHRALRLTDDEGVRREMLGVLRRSYAAIPAYARVTTKTLDPVGRDEVRTAVPARTHAALADELAFLGLWDEAAPELQASGFGTRSPYSMAIYNVRGSRADGAIQTGLGLAGRLPDDFRVELLPREVAELLYPAPYREALRAYAIPMGVDPRFELSIARQESLFKPWVKSAAAARGLMQFIPETANKMAAALEIEPFDQDDLYEPETAVRIGARYLADLFALFPDNPYAVAASYNGGEDNVARWAKRAADERDPDLIVSEISYKETKGYVFKVMNNYWAYQGLYTRELNPR